MILDNRSFNIRYFTAPGYAIALGLMLSAATVAMAENGHDNSNLPVYPPGSKPYGLSYGDWSARWWQWVLSVPPETNPILDGIQGKPFHGNNCDQGQAEPVWFLPGTFGGKAFRTCTVPAGTSLLFPVFNTSFGAGVGDCQTPAPGNPVSCDLYTFGTLTGVPALRAAAADQMNNPGLIEASIDGVPVRNLTTYRVQSPVFSYWLTSDNVYNSVFGYHNPAGLYSPVVSDGYWVMLTPLRAGAHTLHFNAGTFVDVTYILIVEHD